MPDYQQILLEHNIGTYDQLFKFFLNEITPLWTEEYAVAFPKHGEITLQSFEGFSFLIDHIWPDREAADVNRELPETRVVAFFGISDTNINQINRSRMKRSWGKTSETFAPFGKNFDKGHFIAPGFGGPIDVNLFPQRRDVNRGWSDEGKKFRAMEHFVATHPGTLVFARPLYNDFTVCPDQLEYGYFDKSLSLCIEIFPNRNV